MVAHNLPLVAKDGNNLEARTCMCYAADILDVYKRQTIEPGIYIPDWGGVRIEDQILITEDGYENMISTTHELIEL